MGVSARVYATEGIADDPFVRRVADGLVAHVDAMIGQLRTRIAEEDHYYTGATEAMRDEMQRTVGEQLTQVVRSLAGLEPLDYDLPRRVARRRADQGVPMAALLHAYRLGGEVLWEHAGSRSPAVTSPKPSTANRCSARPTSSSRSPTATPRSIREAVRGHGARQVPLFAAGARVVARRPLRRWSRVTAAHVGNRAHSRPAGASAVRRGCGRRIRRR